MRKYTESEKLHHGYKYTTWRNAILRKGEYKCSRCGSIEELTVDHIQPTVTHPELAFDLDNGRVLCNKCRVKGMLEGWEHKRFK